MKKWDREHPNERRENARKWRANNLETVRRIAREWARRDHAKHPEKYAARDRRRYRDDVEGQRERAMKWYYANRDKSLARMKQWRQHNVEKRRILRNRYNKKYRTTDKYRFENALRQRILRAIKRQTKGSHRKCSKTSLLIGCSIPDLKIYLESKFEIGMDWSNFGRTWHIDHIMPCAIFDLSKSEHQKRCFHFSNLQPLFALENIKKGKKVLTNQYPLI